MAHLTSSRRGLGPVAGGGTLATQSATCAPMASATGRLNCGGTPRSLTKPAAKDSSSSWVVTATGHSTQSRNVPLLLPSVSWTGTSSGGGTCCCMVCCLRRTRQSEPSPTVVAVSHCCCCLQGRTEATAPGLGRRQPASVPGGDGTLPLPRWSAAARASSQSLLTTRRFARSAAAPTSGRRLVSRLCERLDSKPVASSSCASGVMSSARSAHRTRAKYSAQTFAEPEGGGWAAPC